MKDETHIKRYHQVKRGTIWSSFYNLQQLSEISLASVLKIRIDDGSPHISVSSLSHTFSLWMLLFQRTFCFPSLQYCNIQHKALGEAGPADILNKVSYGRNVEGENDELKIENNNSKPQLHQSISQWMALKGNFPKIWDTHKWTKELSWHSKHLSGRPKLVFRGI